jgi:2-methylcitrate dehydratase PrpD
MRAGNGWQIGSTNRLGIKKYPLCYCAHRAVDGIIDLVREHHVEPSQVKTIVVSLTPRNAMILRHHAPKTGLEAKFSIEFSLAAALIAGKVGLAELNETFVQRSDVQSMIGRVEIDDSAKELSKDRVILRLADGRQFDSGPIEAVRGDADSPLSNDELWIKFEDCVRPRLTGMQATAAFELLMDMESLSDAGTLVELLRPESVFLKAKGAA